MDTEFEGIEIIGGRRGCGMALSLVRLLREVQKHPGQKVYTNFELPKAAKETLEKYATIERIEVQNAKYKVN